MAKTATKPIEEMTYEAAFAELEKIVAALESGEKPLEESMLLFERGQALTKRCIGLLDKAELKVRTLTGEDVQVLKAEE
jgi:exodeoxyribonuclease VII small subunit